MLVNDAGFIRTAQMALMSVFFSMGPEFAPAASPSDACSLFTASQVSAILGLAVSEGQHPIPSTLLLCDWTAAAGPQIGKKLSVNLMTERAFDVGKTVTQGVTKTPLSGAGDDAYYVTAGGLGTALSMKKGGIYVQIRVYGFSIDKTKALEKILAVQMPGTL